MRDRIVSYVMGVLLLLVASVAVAQHEPLCRNWLNSAWNRYKCMREVPGDQRSACEACVGNHEGGLHHWHADHQPDDRCHRTQVR